MKPPQTRGEAKASGRVGRRGVGGRYQPVVVRRERRHSSAGANPARQLSLQPVAVGADDGGNDIG